MAEYEAKYNAISSLTVSNPDSRIPRQLSYNGRHCIPPSIADRPCPQGESGSLRLLSQLNDIFGTNYGLYSTPGLAPLLDDCISKQLDFGMVYGMLRPWWILSIELLSTISALERADAEARQQAVHDKLITQPMMPPRRVWDLYSNRILPLWIIETDIDVKADSFQRIMPLSAVSHAWAYPSQRQNVITPINCKKWPVPIPQSANLDDVRIELLNMGAEYAWIDVLCLRQRGGIEENLRAAEWELDVPTIGAVYNKCREVIVYLNGLGMPFEESDLERERHWCNRAWTVQEWCLAASMTLAGITAASPSFRLVAGTGPVAQGRKVRYIFQGAAEMNRRSAENELDRMAGLAYNFSLHEHPAYYEAQSVEDAWLIFVQTMVARARGDLFFLFPEAGAGKFEWMPSWYQILAEAEEVASNDKTLSAGLDSKSNPTLTQHGEYTCLGVFLPQCSLEGFHEGPSEACPRWGTAASITDTTLSLKLVAYHSHPIPNGTYALLGNLGHYNSTCRFWAVGRFDHKRGRFTKLSVLQMQEEEIEPKEWLFKKLELNEGGDGDDVGNTDSLYIQDLILT